MERQSTWAWLLLGAVAAGFGRGLQAISIIAWLEPVFLLQFLHSSGFQSAQLSKKLLIISAAVGFKAAGLTFALAGALNNPTFTTLGVSVVGIAAVLGSTALLLVPYLGDVLFRKRFGHENRLSVFVFPTVLTALWIVYSRVSPFGTMGHPAYSQADWKALVLTASFWGIPGIIFLMAWGASVLNHSLIANSHSPPPPSYTASTPLLPKSQRQKVEDNLAWHVKAFAAVFLLALIYGGAQNAVFSGRFFQRSIEDTFHETFGVSCILEDEAQGETLERLWNETERRVVAGDDVILWSETAASLLGDKEEAALLARAGKLARQAAKLRTNNQPGPYIGLSYYKVLETPDNVLQAETRKLIKHHRRGMKGWGRKVRRVGGQKAKQISAEIAQEASFFSVVSELFSASMELVPNAKKASPNEFGDPAAVNSFVLIGPSGDPILRYNKTHPVPIVEQEVVPGRGDLPVVETGLIKMSAAVCFDFRFPELLRQAGQKGVSLMLQPAWTWGPVGLLEANVGAFRAVENGFHLFRCSSSGYTAAISPLYDFELQRETLGNGTITARLPKLQHVPTFYASYGFAFEYICVAFGILLYLLAMLPLSLVAALLRKCPLCVQRCLTSAEEGSNEYENDIRIARERSSYTSLSR